MTLPPPPGRPPTQLPSGLAAALHAAHDAEEAATGPHRRSAFRYTRVLLGGAVAAGYPPQLLADCLGVTVGTVRGRAMPNGWIGLADLRPFLSPRTFAEWRERRLLGQPQLAPDGDELYPAVAVARAFATSPRR